MPYRLGKWTELRVALSRLTLVAMLVLIPDSAFSQPVRSAWTTSRIIGSPEPAPPLQTAQKFSALKFDRPLLIRMDSAAQRLWVVEQGGAVYSFPDDPNVTEASMFVDFQKSFGQLTPHPDARGFGFAYGFRNPWKMTFAPDGELWPGEVGWELYEMVHRVRKGDNYGWSIMEGPQTVRPNARRGRRQNRSPEGRNPASQLDVA